MRAVWLLAVSVPTLLAGCARTPNAPHKAIETSLATASAMPTDTGSGATEVEPPEPNWPRVPRDPGPRLVELTRSHTFAINWRCQAEAPVANSRDAFLDLPAFTLYASGLAIYTANQSAYVADLGVDGARALQQHVLDLGFEKIEERTDDCHPSPRGIVCIEVSDADNVTVGVRLPSGKMRRLASYAGRASDPAALQRIVEYLENWQSDHPAPYVSERGSLVIEACEPEQDGERWPLDRDLLRPRDGLRLWVRVVERNTLVRLAEDGLLPLRGRVYRNGGSKFVVHWVPWLPDVDYAEEAARYAEPSG